MHIFLGILSAVCLGYYIFVVAYAGFSVAFVTFWLIAAIGFAALSVLFYMNKKRKIFLRLPKALIITVCGMICAGIALFIFLMGCVVSGMISEPENKADYVVVLGARIKGETLTKSLRLRLDKTLEYYEDYNDVIIIVSGGQGEGEDIPEAEAMYRYLTEKGIPSEKIIKEDKSTTTNENLKFSSEIICGRGDGDANVLICSNNFHIFRAIKLAKHIGIKNVEGLASLGDGKLLLSYMVRDSLAIFKEFLMGNISLSD